MLSKPRKRQKEEDQKVDGFKIEPFSNIGYKLAEDRPTVKTTYE